MRASDVLLRNVVSRHGTATVKLLVEHDISALPVIDDDPRSIGIISEEAWNALRVAAFVTSIASMKWIMAINDDIDHRRRKHLLGDGMAGSAAPRHPNHAWPVRDQQI
jgi:hypothetical protein